LHALSKDIVERCADRDVGTLVVGDPSGVDEDDWGRHGNKRLDNWAYKRLMNLLDYKARERGIEVEQVDERGTSSSCSVCSHEDGDSRVERGLWKCDRCGVVAHGDVNGADNIRLLGKNLGQRSSVCLLLSSLQKYPVLSPTESTYSEQRR